MTCDPFCVKLVSWSVLHLSSAMEILAECMGIQRKSSVHGASDFPKERKGSAMEICSALLGERIALLEADEFEGKSVKQFLAAKVGVSRFRQRLLSEDGSEINDDEIFDWAPVKVHLLLLELWSPDAEHNQKMIAACSDNDPAAVEELLQRPQEPNLTDEHGQTPLHFAAAGGHLAPAKLLLEARAETDSRQEADGRTPLHLGSFGGHLDVVQLLLEAGADKDITENYGCTALGLAACRGHLDVVRLLLEAGAGKEKTSHGGFTALELAAAQGHLDTVRLLLKAGADKDLAQKIAVPLAFAARSGHCHVVRLLLDAGADKEAAYIAHGSKLTALGIAAERGHLDVVRLLLEAGADKEKTSHGGLTALELAAGKGNLEVVCFLLEASADRDTASGRFASLQAAASGGHLDVVRCLIEVGADKEAAHNEISILQTAASAGQLDVVRFLLEYYLIFECAELEAAASDALRLGHVEMHAFWRNILQPRPRLIERKDEKRTLQTMWKFRFL